MTEDINKFLSTIDNNIVSIDSKPNVNCLLDARSDAEAAVLWLEEHRLQKTTYRSYRREVCRFLLWLNKIGKKLSQLRREDIRAYELFLANPQPVEEWCAPRGGPGNKFGTKNWKPFTGGLSAKSINIAFVILKSFMQYLVNALYISANPFMLAMKATKVLPSLEEQALLVQDRILEQDEWNAILNTLKNLPEDTNEKLFYKKRSSLIFNILYYLGLRVFELSSHTWSAFRYYRGNWWFFVVGKGGKLGKVPVHDKLLLIIKDWRKFINITELPSAVEDLPIICARNIQNAISDRQIHNIVKQVAIKASVVFENTAKIAKLSKVSPHWLRHLSASEQNRSGIPLSIIQQNLRHSNISTTQIYLHDSDEDRFSQIQKMSDS